MFDRLRDRIRRRQLEDLADLARADGHEDVADALEEAPKAVPLITLFLALAPVIISMLSGQPVDWLAVMKIIQDLLANRTAEIPVSPPVA